MRRQQDIEVITGQRALLCDKPDMLQHRVPMGIGHNLLFDAVAAGTAGIDQLECRHTLGYPMNLRVGCTLFLGEEIRSVRDDQPHVADAGVVDPRVVNLIEYPMA
jgi:hypothetical protein